MRNHPRPRVIVSRCLGFDACRWNGEMIADDFVQHLRSFVEFVTVCPEVEIGLGVPRPPIRQVRTGDDVRLVQPTTGRDISDLMRGRADEILSSAQPVDGFLLKHKSPSCGLHNVPVYPSTEKSSAVDKGAGFFGSEVRRRFADYPVEDEGRLKNFVIREHFLTRLFALTDFRLTVRGAATPGALVEFQARNKLLLMGYDQVRMRELGRLVANPEGRPWPEVLDAYEPVLREALRNPMRFASAINVLQHALGYFKDKLEPREKTFFLETLEEYRRGKVPLSTVNHVLQAWIVRFKENYLAEQTFFTPYPLELLQITDSGQGRDLR